MADELDEFEKFLAETKDLAEDSSAPATVSAGPIETVVAARPAGGFVTVEEVAAVSAPSKTTHVAATIAPAAPAAAARPPLPPAPPQVFQNHAAIATTTTTTTTTTTATAAAAAAAAAGTSSTDAAPAIGVAHIPGVGTTFDPQLAAQQQHQLERMREMEAAKKLEDIAEGKRPAKAPVLMAGGKVWSDESLQEWDPNDSRLFVGNLGPDVNDEVLHNAFVHYASLIKTKVVRNVQTGKPKGYGFASFSDPREFLHALDHMNKKFIGNRPVMLSRSKWQDRLATGKDKARAHRQVVNKRRKLKHEAAAAAAKAEAEEADK